MSATAVLTDIIWDHADSPYRLPANLDTGVRCGNHDGYANNPRKVYHNSAAAVQECYRIHREWAEEQRAEAWAEGGYVRMMENWGAEQTHMEQQMARAHGLPIF